MLAYSRYSGSLQIFSVQLNESDLLWSFRAIVPLYVVNSLNVAGVIYLILKRRYDMFRMHFHSLMLWITVCSLCLAQHSTTTLLTAMVVSTILAMISIKEFAFVRIHTPMLSETFLFAIGVILLFGDLYTNNEYLRNIVVSGDKEREVIVNKVSSVIAKAGEDDKLVSNFCPSELSVRAGRKVVAVEGDFVPASELITTESTVSTGSAGTSGGETIYIVERLSKPDSVPPGCKLLLNTSYFENDEVHFVEAIKCESENE